LGARAAVALKDGDLLPGFGFPFGGELRDDFVVGGLGDGEGNEREIDPLRDGGCRPKDQGTVGAASGDRHTYAQPSQS